MQQTQTKVSSKIVKRKRESVDSEVIIPNDSVNAPQMTKNNVLKEISVRRRELRSLAERIAGDDYHYLNYYYEGGKGYFPQEHKMQTVSKFFPFAEGGPLFVDEPNMEHEFSMCERKKEVMKKLGHRYLIIKPGASELDLIEAIA